MPENASISPTNQAEIFETIFNNAVDCMIVIDRTGIIQMVNGAAIDLFGYTREEMLGQNVAMLMPAHHRERHDQYMKHYLSTGEARIIGIGREEYGQRRDGSLFPMRLSVTEVLLEDRHFFAGIIHNLTALRAAEAEIERMNRELERKVIQRTIELEEKNNQLLEINLALNREIKERQEMEAILRDNERELQAALEKEKELNELKSRFVSMASHEFRTPLSTILSSAGLVNRYPREDQHTQRQKHVDRIKSSVSMLTGILDDFLSLAKLEEGRISINPESFKMTDLAQEVIEALRPNLKKGQLLHFQDQAPSQEVFQERNLLKHVLYNLLSNAIKYSPEDRPILLRLEGHSDKIHLEVEDQGIGIPVQDQAHLFTRFFRAKNVINIQGTGLGLNIVRNYVNLMGGSIRFTSREGVGSTFQVTLPTRIPEQRNS